MKMSTHLKGYQYYTEITFGGKKYLVHAPTKSALEYFIQKKVRK